MTTLQIVPPSRFHNKQGLPIHYHPRKEKCLSFPKRNDNQHRSRQNLLIQKYKINLPFNPIIYSILGVGLDVAANSQHLILKKTYPESEVVQLDIVADVAPNVAVLGGDADSGVN